MMEDHMEDKTNKPSDKPDKSKKLPVALRDDKTKQFTNAAGAEKKG